jgi:hypothetical protein
MEAIIYWRFKGQKRVHHGRPIALSAAIAWCKYANKEYPELIHWIKNN